MKIQVLPHHRNISTALTILLLPIVLAGIAPVTAAAQGNGGADRSGFTFLLNMGVGWQRDQFLEETNTGLAGLNLGIGGFLSPDLALMFRASGTNASIGSVNQVSGTGAIGIQYWLSDRFNLEGGVGVGFWDIEGDGESGLGLIGAASYSFWTNGRHNLYFGAEFAPTFADPDPVYNFGLVFGWQML